MLPSDFPKWNLVRYYFEKWSRNGTLEDINDMLRDVCEKSKVESHHPALALLTLSVLRQHAVEAKTEV